MGVTVVDGATKGVIVVVRVIISAAEILPRLQPTKKACKYFVVFVFNMVWSGPPSPSNRSSRSSHSRSSRSRSRSKRSRSTMQIPSNVSARVPISVAGEDSFERLSSRAHVWRFVWNV